MADQHTFLFADLAGFTALTEAHGDSDAADLAAEFFQLVRDLLSEHDAEEVKSIGDAMMLRCDNCELAVELGLRIVEEVAARPQFPVVRVGMHSGPAVQRGGDWFGAAVNVAARVSAAAAGNEVLLTERTRRGAGEPAGIELQKHGSRKFKNVAEPIVVYKAIREGEESADLPIDPVCRMGIDPEQAAGRFLHEGTEYYFCSLDCARAFTADPQRYAQMKPGDPTE